MVECLLSVNFVVDQIPLLSKLDQLPTRRPQDIWWWVCISICPKVGKRIASMVHCTQHGNTNWAEQAAQWVERLYSILRPFVRIILKNMLIVIKKKV